MLMDPYSETFTLHLSYCPSPGPEPGPVTLSAQCEYIIMYITAPDL